MKHTPSTSEVHGLFANSDREEVWTKVSDIVVRVSSTYDFAPARIIFDDVMRLFCGEYPGYCAIKTPYHDLSHTLDVFMCAIRLTHGVHISGTPLTDSEITLIMIATLMHDIGYAQRLGEDAGTGAQHTRDHVKRGIDFMQGYLAEKAFPAAWTEPLQHIMLGTNHFLEFRSIAFRDERERLLGKIVATADMVGQMSDRNYLEKLLFLYMEFQEANLGNYQSIHDLLQKSIGFYKITKEKRLDGELEGIYTNLTFHFNSCFGTERNYYLESMERNMEYLSRASQFDEAGCLAMLKRGGIVKKAGAVRNRGKKH